MDLQGKHIVVAGAARSGVAVSVLLKNRGAEPFLTDNAEITDAVVERLNREEIPFESGRHGDKAMQGDFLVLSPGVPSHSEIAKSYSKQNKDIYSEIEVASWFNRSPMVAVTGTNGKTSVTSWLAHTWKTAGLDCILAGNIGRAFSEEVDKTSPGKHALLEVSSFQLDHIDTFHPDVSMILNITPDHLDRYQNSFDLYAAAK